VTATGGNSTGLTLTTDAATALTFAGDKTVSLALADTGLNAATVTSISSTNTAGVTITSALATGVTFAGGDGADAITLGATTKAITTGAGDDTVTLSGGTTALGVGGSVDAGAGTDTLKMNAADAVTASASTTFEGTVSGFERLELNAMAANSTVNLANMDDISYVISNGGAFTLTANNVASGGTLVIKAAQTAATVGVTNAATGTADVLNVKVTGAAAVAAGTVTAANVETINVETDDTAASPAGGFQHTATINAANATALNVTGDAGAALTLTGSIALATINTSGVTKGAVSLTTVADVDTTFVGGATATTVSLAGITTGTKTGSITTGAGDDTITGGSGADTINAGNGTNSITGGAGLDTMTGGTGVDTYVYTAVGDSQGTKVDVITNFQVGTGGDVINVNAVTGGTGAYLGVANGYGAVLTSLTGTVGDAVLDTVTSTIYIDVNGDGALNNSDMAIQLTGVTSGLVAANFTF
jgi:S-layer protein